MIAVRDRLEEFGDAVVAVVTFAEPKRLAGYRVRLALPFAVLSDERRALYEMLGASRLSTRQVWSPGTLCLYARLLMRGRRLRRPTEDTHQSGADLVVGRDGRVRYLALPTGPDRRPPIDELIAALG